MFFRLMVFIRKLKKILGFNQLERGSKMTFLRFKRKVLNEQRNNEEDWDFAYKRRVVSVAVSRKKKVATDAILSVANGVFPI